MGVKSTDVQGTKTYIVDVPATKWADCAAAVTALEAGAEALCTQSIGNLTRSRDITEYGCMSSDESTKSAGSIKYGDTTIELLFDNDDATGQAALLKAFDDNESVIIGFKHSDGKTIVWSEGVLAGDEIAYPADGKVGYSVTVSWYGGFNRCTTTP